MKKERVDINLEIQFTAPFHSGTGLNAGLVDRGILRNHQGFLYIPAATFKGVLRQKVEELISIFSSNSGKKPLCLSPNDTTNNDFLTYYTEKPVMIEQLFGSNVKQGQLCFSNLEMKQEDKDFFFKAETPGASHQILQVEHRTQTRVYRSTKTVAQGALFNSEYGIRDLRFTGAISGWLNAEPDESGENPVFSELFFLLGGLKMLDRIAGNKSTGMGAFVYIELSVKLGKRPVNINAEIFSDSLFAKLNSKQDQNQ